MPGLLLVAILTLTLHLSALALVNAWLAKAFRGGVGVGIVAGALELLISLSTLYSWRSQQRKVPGTFVVVGPQRPPAVKECSFPGPPAVRGSVHP